MQELVSDQVNREVGELSAVLDLDDEKRARLEKILKQKKKLPAIPSMESDKSGQDRERAESTKSLEEELRALLSPEQFSQYQEYTEKKKALSGASSVDKELFELKYRLDLTEEQEAPVKEILREHTEKLQRLSLSTTPEDDTAPLERIQDYLDQKSAVDQDTARRVQPLLNASQYAGFVHYQEEKAAEVSILKKLLKEEAKATPPSP